MGRWPGAASHFIQQHVCMCCSMVLGAARYGIKKKILAAYGKDCVRCEDLSQEDLLCASYYNGKLPPFLLDVWEYGGCESCSSSLRV